MAEHTVKAFTEELDALTQEVARMGGLAETAVNDSLAAVGRRDTELAQAVIQRDGKIDQAQRDVEKRAIKLFALRQPMASDLRVVLTAWRIAGELERVGDLAKNIAKRTLILNQAEPIQLTRSVERMGKIAASHLNQVLNAYANRDVQAAVNVWNADDNIDAHYNSLFRELLTYMIEDPRMISSCAHLLFVAKNLERIGDHGTNIAEYIHFLVTGEEIATQRPRADAEASD
ncbi:phosphate signaling complex protein PhoU [Terricaulis sp.]|jgi:phosphate transport system protein|uniref:phosphate signaling complex protein PhoU n=1 Tax=Terricaulis sp. TaxID=2768686 RepID=UPI002AC6D933|nr:phosphate signaling complex protein PhoU [Terricaulis sp.]MDZ4692870.1 phosphate signaling complex protein PhoU [Terricaulis sp.]